MKQELMLTRYLSVVKEADAVLPRPMRVEL
jgi:hypothetical protein